MTSVLSVLLSLITISSLVRWVFSYQVLFDFTANSTVDTFYESSDTARNVGMSKGSISLIQSEEVRRAVFFSLLNPQPDSACFAGVQTKFDEALNWSEFNRVSLQSRGQGEYSTFKVVLKDSSSESNSSLAFEQYFQASRLTADNSSFGLASLPLENFVCSYRGVICEEKLDITSITTFGLQAAGGVYSDSISQQGVASLELNWVVLY